MKAIERLTAVSGEIAEVRTELGILDEQLAFQRDVADDARIRSLVAETPLADREARIARDDLARMERVREDAARRLDSLLAERDALLDRLAAEPRLH